MTKILERPNRATPDEMATFVDQFEELENEIASERGIFMSKCKAIRERQRELLDDAKSQGLPKNVVKAVVRARELEAKASAVLDGLEDDAVQVFKDIREALGDFADSPLGAAAVKAEGEQDPATAAIVKAAKDWDESAPKH